jgi:hypothetical protein
MKPKALMLSAAILLGSAALAAAQTQSATPAPAPAQTGAQSSSIPSTGSSAAQSTKPHSGATKQAQIQAAKASKRGVMAARRHEPRTAEHDRATTALNLLEEKGYRDFSSLRPVGRDYEITANQNGKSVTVVVDPQTKTVRTRG